MKILRPKDGSAPGLPQPGKKREPRVKNAQRHTIGTEKFDSKHEAAVYVDLKRQEGRGQITDLKRQVNIPLLGRDGPIRTPAGRPMHYRADFTFKDAEGLPCVLDAKGHKTEVYLMKKAILAAQGVTIIEIGTEDRCSHGAWVMNDYRALRDKITGPDAL